ncbi:MAG: hypothetical protein NTY12_00860 [Candidatus Falkowbacteria bacterium]|nr:hypothetical protein [Candidatus Falkowbacteria bacterium]
MPNPEEHDYEQVNKVNSLFEEALKSQVISDLKNGLSFQEILDNQQIEKPLEQAEEVECCDGRCPHKKGSYKAIAGAGILLSKEELNDYIKSNPGMKYLKAHEGCGAGKIAFEKAKSAGTLPEGIFTAEQYVEWWTKTTAAEYNLEYKYTPAKDFQDSEMNHHEAGLMINFDPALIKGMPNVFVSHSAECLNDDYVKNEISILTGIAFSDHGFGNRLSQENPFYIFICAKNEAEKEHLSALAKEAVASYGDKVVIESAVSPF